MADTTKNPSRTPTRCVGAPGQALEREAEPLVIAPVARKGQTGSLYQSATAAGNRTTTPRYFPSVPRRLSEALTSTASRRLRGRTASAGDRHSALTTRGASAASVKTITRSPACSTSSRCGNIALPFRTTAPMSAPRTGISLNFLPDVLARVPAA